MKYTHGWIVSGSGYLITPMWIRVMVFVCHILFYFMIASLALGPWCDYPQYNHPNTSEIAPNNMRKMD